MAVATLIQLRDVTGRDIEGVALAYKDGKLLPPGTWLVRRSDNTEQVYTIEEMPFHWQEQVKKWGDFGRTLDV